MKYRIVKEETIYDNSIYHIEKKTLFGWKEINWSTSEKSALQCFENCIHPKKLEKKVICEYDTKLKRYII